MKNLHLSTGERIIVDDDDFEEASRHVWHKCGLGYAGRTLNGRTVYMHRLIMNAKKGDEIDHINRNKLDNRKSNLRFCNHSLNQANRPIHSKNTTGFLGVTWHKKARKYQTRIRISGRKTHLGLFEDIKEAARVYNEAAIKQFGEFAQLNETT